MARIDDLVAQVADKALRPKLLAALADMKRRQRFGLVFEEHIPETTTLLRFPIHVGAVVQRRDDPDGQLYVVRAIASKGRVAVEPEGGGPQLTESSKDLLVVKRFGDPIFPALTSLGALRRGPENKPYHAVINGENFHTLQLLVYLYESKVDCIYIDPPYNTGARDWKYNNRYVDSNDSWRHSKWLSFMEKRLKLAKRLLKPDGVLIVTIDEHEVHHLGMLLERVFPNYLRYTITAVINPKGTFKQNFGRVDEQIFFVVPDIGRDVIVPRPTSDNGGDGGDSLADSVIRKLVALGPGAVDALPEGVLDGDEKDRIVTAFDQEEDIGDEEPSDEEDDPDREPASPDYEDWFLRRRGQESSYRHQRSNSFYAILINVEERKVVGVGPALAIDAPYKEVKRNGVLTVYPIDAEGHERVWRYSRETMQRYIDAGEIVVGSFSRRKGTWTLNHRKLKKDVRRHKTVWWEKRHDAGVHGTNIVNNLLGARGLFPFPKSVYAVQDALAAVVRNRPNALILDFFAGSGTSLHATCLLNAADGGARRCVLVTNNEVDEKTARQLQKDGIHRGDREYEQHGIFEQATRPRVSAVIMGKRPDGTKVPGSHVDGRPFARGFEENVEFFRVDYLEPDDVDIGNQFEAILPSLWLAAGGVAARDWPANADMVVPPSSPFAILLREERFRKFRKTLDTRTDITHVWIVTDSEDAFAEMKTALPQRVRASMLYRDYLRNFRINTRQNL